MFLYVYDIINVLKGFFINYFMKINFKKGFTLIELLVVVAIIGILAAVVLTALNKAQNSGSDAGVKENLRNANAQAEIFWNTNTAVPNSYTDVCKNTAQVGGVNTIALFMKAAAKDAGLGSSYTWNGTGTGAIATCNDSANAWAAEVPLSGSTVVSPNMWCVDNTGKSKPENATIGAGTVCA